MTITHIQSFWDVPVGAGNIGPLQRARLAKATLALGHNPDIVFASFSGGYTDAERPEISLITSAEVEPVSFQSTIKAALVAQDISVEPTVKNETRYHELGATELDNFAAAARVPDLALAHEAIDELSQLAFQPISADEATPSPAELLEALTAAAPDAPAESFADVSPKQIIQGFSVDVKLFQALRTARGDAIKNHIKGLSNTFGSLKKEKNSNAATAIMVGSGLITVGSKMWSVYAGIKAAGSVSLMISEIIASVGGIVALGGIIAAIAAAFGLLWILLKDALNVCLLVNSRDDVSFGGDHIKNGQRGMIVQSLPKADVNPSRKPGSIPCGFYAYHKYRIFDIPSGGAQPAIEAQAPPSDPGAPAPDVPIGFYGSCMGIDFRFPSGHRFAVGMDCPNTILGGRNSTVVTTKSAKDAAELANDTHTSAQSIGVGPYKCTIRRAAALGSTNYAVCVID